MSMEIILTIVLTALIVSGFFLLRDYLKKTIAATDGSSSDLLEISERVSFDAGQLNWLIDSNSRQINSMVEIVNNIASSSITNATNTEEVSAGIDQLSKIAADIFQKTRRIEEIFDAVLKDSLENRGWIERSGNTLIDISNTIEATSEALGNLNNAVGKVNNILESIKGVTEEVNLLSLNASIEAARAGEAGRGFTVVANEVKNLSEKTDKMTGEVQNTINEVNNQLKLTGDAIGAGVEKISEVEEVSRRSVQSFDGIVGQLEEVKGFITELSRNTEDQQKVTDQSNNAVYAISNDSADISNSIGEMSKIFEEQGHATKTILEYSRNLHKVGYDLHSLSASNKSNKILIFGINPFTDPVKIKEQYLPVITEAAKGAGMQTRIVIVSDYKALTSYIKDGLIDVGWFSPTAYVNAKNEVNLVPLVTPVKYGKGSYEGIIITHSESGLKNLNDLKGATFSFVDPLSTSGYLYPLQLIKKAGIDIDKDFESYNFLGNHDNVIKAVKERRVDAGATFTGSLKMARDEGTVGEEIVILGETETIPNDAIAAKASLSPLLINSLRKQFESISESKELADHLKKSHIDGFQRVEDSAYDIIRKQQEETL